jgi:Holliday junction resolvasome RuvABC endonuclease subunit
MAGGNPQGRGEIQGVNENKLILGIDPGSHTCGYAIATKSPEGKVLILECGRIRNHSRDVTKRIRTLRHGLMAMMHANDIESGENIAIAYECPYSGTGTGSVGRSGLQHVWMAIGMILTLPAEDYIPLHVATVQSTWGRKRSMDRKTGKEHAIAMANQTFGLELEADENDTADAIWVAVAAFGKGTTK